MVIDTSVFTLSSCPEASLTCVLPGARVAYSVQTSGSVSARITLGPAEVSTTASVGVGICHRENWYC